MTTPLAPAPSDGATTWPPPLHDLTMAVAAARRPADIFDAAIDSLNRNLGVERAAVLLFDPDGVMRFKAWRGLSDAYRSAVEGHSPWKPDTTDAAPVLVEDVAGDAELALLRPTLEAEGIAALAFIPLVIGQRLLGKFMLYYGEPHAFAAQEVLTAQAVAAHVAFAIEQQQHRLAERRYEQLLRAVGVAVYTTDAAGRITFYNDEAAALWGWRPELGTQKWCGSARIYTKDGAPLPHEECPMAISIKTGVPVRGAEAIAERPDGTRVNFLPYPTPLFDDEGRVVGGINVLVDITARKQAETALHEKEARLVAALAEKEEVIAARNETIRLYEAVQAQLASLVEASGALIDTEGGDNAVRHILEIASGLLGADAHAMWRFIEERDEWVITSSRGLSQDYVAGSRIPGEGRQQLNEALIVEDVDAESQLEYLRDRYVSEGVRSLFVVPLKIGEQINGTLAFYYREPHQFSDLEVRVGMALANLASASLTSSLWFEENTRAAQDLRAALAAKDEFLSLISHELRTPLTTIRGNAGILFRNQALDAESRAGALADIVSESERLHRIIENLLLLARAEQGQGLDEEPLLAIRVVERVLARHRQQHPARTYEIAESETPHPVLMSEACLEQVMENLLSNAEKYSPPSQPIRIELEREPHEVRIRVLDRGPGISTAEAERIFEPFYRSGSMISRAEGLGIGLAVCKRLVEAQGGRMWAATRESGGSEFGFALPRSDDEDHEA